MVTSTDGGGTWVRQELGSASLIGLAACPDGSFVGIDFNHKVWSGDGSGAHWKSSDLDKPRVPLAVTCDPINRWHIAGTGAKIATSKDKGATWKVADLGEDTQITAIQFLDDKQGVALGEFGLFLSTTDGGATWQKGPAVPGEFYPYAALFVSRAEGWVSGIAGQILHTADGGKTWQKQVNATKASLYRLFLHEGVPVGVGAGGTIARYENGTWRQLPYPDQVPVFLGGGTSLPSQSVILIGGPGGLVRPVSIAKQ